MTPPALSTTLFAVPGDLDDTLAALPSKVLELLKSLDAPPRLQAHLRLVHDVALQLVAVIEERFSIDLDTDTIAFGAATHDIGKALFVEELSGPGNAHESAGRDLLVAHGFDAQRARFAVTHAMPPKADHLSVEDLLVALADKVWKGKRSVAHEEQTAKAIADLAGIDFWHVYPVFTEALDQIAAGADVRLAWQNQHPVTGQRAERSE